MAGSRRVWRGLVEMFQIYKNEWERIERDERETKWGKLVRKELEGRGESSRKTNVRGGEEDDKWQG